MKKFTSHILKEFKDFEDLIEHVEENKELFTNLVLDIETNSVIEKTAKIWGIGLAFTDEEAFYVPIRKKNGESWWQTENEELAIIQEIRTWTEQFKLIGHNIIYDTLVLQSNYPMSHMEGTWWDHIYSDTILLKHALEEEKPFGLKDISVKYLGEWADKAQEAMKESVKANGGSTSKENFEMYKAETDILGEYCCWDVLLTKNLFDIFEPRLEKEGLKELFYDIETMPLYREVTIPMKWNGFPIDVNYFEKLDRDITEDMDKLKKDFLEYIHADVRDYILNKYDTKVPISKRGDFPKELFWHAELELPVDKKGKVTMSRKALEKLYQDKENLNPSAQQVLGWLLEDSYIEPNLIKSAQRTLYEKRNPDEEIFNINSKYDLRHLFFNVWKFSPLKKTETGLGKVDDEFLNHIVEEKPIVADLIDYNKLNKLKGTYITGLLDRQVDGVIYTSMLQFGTTSGRYASRNPNLQNLPRPKDEDAGLSELVLKYTNAIRAGFICGEGHKIIDADYSALEPRCFAHMSGEEKLQAVFAKGEDLYSRIAIDVFGLDNVSANPKDDNFLKKVMPEYRQKTKVFCLAVVYGAEAGRISQAMKVPYEEAKLIIEMYLDAYPGLKKYMEDCDHSLLNKGEVKTQFGRVRHLPLAKELYKEYGPKILNKNWAKKQGLGESYWKIKNMRNLSKNHPIQGLAGHIVNRASIAIARRFKEANINGYIGLQVHDQLVCRVIEEHAKKASEIVQDCMENTTVITVPMIAEPEIAENLRDSH